MTDPTSGKTLSDEVRSMLDTPAIADTLKEPEQPGLKALQDDLRNLINHMATRIAYAESRRQALGVIASALVAACIALLTLTITQVHPLPIRVALIALSALGILTGASTWAVYMRQTNFKYPFTQVSRTWKWFYRYALKNPDAFNAGILATQSEAQVRAGKEAFESQAHDFAKQQVVGLCSRKDSVAQDFEQVYLLHVNERYKNLFLTQLRKVLIRGLLGAVVIAALVLVGVWKFAPRPTGQSESSFDLSGRKGAAGWRSTGSHRAIGLGGEEVQLLVNFRLLDTLPVLPEQVAAVDDIGLRLPIFVEAIHPLPRDNSVDRKYAVLLWMPAALRDRLKLLAVAP